jgi:antitoxin VapB
VAFTINDPETERLATEVARMTGASEAEAVYEALAERRGKVSPKPQGKGRPKDMQKWLETEIWPLVPRQELGRPPLTKVERAALLGYGLDEG